MSQTSYADAVAKTNSEQTHSQTDGLSVTSINANNAANTESKKDSLARIQSIPVVQETLDRVLAIIKGNSLLAALYARGEQLTQVFYAHTKNLVNPVLSTADIYASKGLDAVESRYPGAFKANTEDVIKTARGPADHAVESFRTRLEGAQTSLVSVQDRLSGAVSAVSSRVPRTQEDAQKAAQAYLSELVKLRDQTSAQIADAPENVKQVYEPLLASLQNGINDVNKMLTDKDVAVKDRATSVLNYSKENLPAVVNDTLTHLKGMVIAGKKEAEKKTAEAQKKASE